MSKLRSAVWFTTMACNFNCDYCWEVQAETHGDFKPEPFKKPEDWIAAWLRLRPEILDITGGEPFMQPGLIDIITALAAGGVRMAITSNLSYPILEFVRRVKPSEVFSITASYHPSQNGTRKNPMNEDIFFGRILLLREFGFNNVTVNIVAYPEQMWLIPKYVELCDRHRIRWHIDPYSSIMYSPWEYTAAEKNMLKQYVTAGRTNTPDDFKTVSCSGGIDHISVQPDGSAWRCILERQQWINPLGNIFDESFSLLGERQTCKQRQHCPGCDRDKVSVAVQADSAMQLPIL